MTKKIKVNNNLGKKLVLAPAIMVASLGLCLVCLVYLNKFGTNQKKILGANVMGSAVITENTESNSADANSASPIDADNANITFWQKIVEENPTYRDGWIRLAVGYYEGGDVDKAIEALDKAKEIDPNNETVKSLNKIIQR